MILGVYWYFKFPENLYHFRFFKFFDGSGGHIDNAAELVTRVRVHSIDNLKKKLEELKLQFPQTYLHLNINENQMIISTGNYQLFDYYFQFALEIEALLVCENAVLVDFGSPFESQFTKNYHPERKLFKNIEYRFIQMVNSDSKKNNAENFSIRIDCNLPLARKKDFIHEVSQVCKEENIHIFYYHDFDFRDQCNLMLFFTNGRQYKNHIQVVDINSFGNKINHITQKYPLHFGHFGGLQYYPLHGPHVKLMVDQEYILHQ
ncbi:hypothetical protein [Chryseobacterium sp. PMSZPI]|uniref:hypothetical protein n=1 Tax=Chryseobacterium sp. PMSZPI TaxID=1033900 RepID=UPI000C3363AD|nr:hypothetical protein [Chryseobacterium sp. PMSZPI]PKF74165.1 hypothetical protein CW752_10735 [Chryseobacterium sp. PMSZPI]